ncbi:MAG: hypothetical protein V4671_16930 [Armatimonadota bacterium]
MESGRIFVTITVAVTCAIPAQTVNADGCNNATKQCPHDVSEQIDAVNVLLCFSHKESAHVGGAGGGTLESNIGFLQCCPILQSEIHAEEKAEDAGNHKQ